MVEAGFTGRGVINGLAVRCLSSEVQVLCHAHGCDPTEKDSCDMKLLRARFGVELPPHLRRDATAGRAAARELWRSKNDEADQPS